MVDDREFIKLQREVAQNYKEFKSWIAKLQRAGSDMIDNDKMLYGRIKELEAKVGKGRR